MPFVQAERRNPSSPRISASLSYPCFLGAHPDSASLRLLTSRLFKSSRYLFSEKCPRRFSCQQLSFSCEQNGRSLPQLVVAT